MHHIRNRLLRWNAVISCSYSHKPNVVNFWTISVKCHFAENLLVKSDFLLNIFSAKCHFSEIVQNFFTAGF